MDKKYVVGINAPKTEDEFEKEILDFFNNARRHTVSKALRDLFEERRELKKAARMALDLTVLYPRPNSPSGYEFSNKVTNQARKALTYS